jgi:hypothetical protein
MALLVPARALRCLTNAARPAPVTVQAAYYAPLRPSSPPSAVVAARQEVRARALVRRGTRAAQPRVPSSLLTPASRACAAAARAPARIAMASNVMAPGALNAPSAAAAYTAFLILGAGLLLSRQRQRGGAAPHGRRRRRVSRARSSAGGVCVEDAPAAAAEDPRAVQLLATAEAEGAKEKLLRSCLTLRARCVRGAHVARF